MLARLYAVHNAGAAQLAVRIAIDLAVPPTPPLLTLLACARRDAEQAELADYYAAWRATPEMAAAVRFIAFEAATTHLG